LAANDASASSRPPPIPAQALTVSNRMARETKRADNLIEFDHRPEALSDL
jgi:hypothetical protein